MVAAVGRHPPDPALVARARELRQGGMPRHEVAEVLGVGSRTVARWLSPGPQAPKAASGRSGGATPPSPSKTGATGQRGGTAGAPQAEPRKRVPPTPIPENLRGVAADLWILDEEIRATREQLADARARAAEGGSTHGLAGLGKHLADLVRRRADLRPPEASGEEAEERRWRAEADAVIAKIEQGVRVLEAK